MKHSRVTSILLAAVLVFVLAAPGMPAQGQVDIQESRAFSAIGTTITYQGRFTEAGEPGNGFFDFEFRLFDALTGGNQVGSTVSFENREVIDGLLTADLDFGPNAFNGQPRWLEISVRPGSSTGTFTKLDPRQALTPAPYAIYASSAPWSGLSGVPAGFADGVDNDTDTTYTAGSGLTLSGTQFSLNTSYTNGLYWATTGNASLPATNFLGSTDSVTITFGVNNTPVFQLVPNETPPSGFPQATLPGEPAALFTQNRGGRAFGTGQGSIVKIGERYRDNSIFAWGRVNANGNIYSDFGVHYVSHPITGTYRIHTTAYTAEGASMIPAVIAEIESRPTTPADMRLVYINQIGDGPSEVFEVYITDGLGTPVNNDFVFMVTGR